MKEVTDSIINAFKNRIVNPVYGTFTLVWALLNWNFLYSLFALSEDIILAKTGMMKNEYLMETFFNLSDYMFWLESILSFMLTYLIVWWFPKWFLLSGYSQEVKYSANKKIVRLQTEASLKREEAKRSEAEVEARESKRRIYEVDPTVKWHNEYQALKSNKRMFEYFGGLYEIIYNRRGRGMGTEKYRDTTALIAYLDSIEAVRIDTNGTVSLTDKGNYFMKKYIEDGFAR